MNRIKILQELLKGTKDVKQFNYLTSLTDKDLEKEFENRKNSLSLH